MDRRLFLTGVFGVAGAAALASAVRPINAVAGVPSAGSGILDELDALE
ncbi:MAG: protamine-2 (modular protein), partial [Mesorhizobium sp.]